MMIRKPFACMLLTAMLLATFTASHAQSINSQTQPASVTIYRDLVRFVVSDADQLRIEIFNQNQEMIFDSGLVTGTALDWFIHDQQGQPVESGLYSYLLSINSNTDLAQRGNVIVDREREGLIEAPPLSLSGGKHKKGVVHPFSDGVFDVNATSGSYNINAARMGIGTSTPLVRLHVGAGAAPPITAGSTLLIENGLASSILVKSTSGGEMFAYQDQNNGIFGTATTHPLGIRTNNVNRVWIEAGGNVGIGTQAPGQKLSVAGTIESTSGGFKFPDGSVQATAVTGGGGMTLPFSGSTSSSSTAFAVTNNGTGEGLYGKGKNGVHGQTTSANDSGVWGENLGGGYGVAGSTTSSGQTSVSPAGVWGHNGGGGWGVKGTSNGVGVFGAADTGVYGAGNVMGVRGFSTNGSGVYGDNGNSNTTGHAGFFNGRVTITGNLSANNLPLVKFSQAHDTGAGGTAYGNQDVDTVNLNAPADGVLIVSAFVNVRVGVGHHLVADFSLLDATNTVLTVVTAEAESRVPGYDVAQQQVLHISWVVSVVAGSVTLKTHIRNVNNDTSAAFFDHNLTVLYQAR